MNNRLRFHFRRCCEPGRLAVQKCPLQGFVAFGMDTIVNREPKVHSSGPPHNPELRELVNAKRQNSHVGLADQKMGFKGWHERGYLPHRDEKGLTQLVTFRTTDSFPATLRSEWAELLKIEIDRERREKLELYLDKGRGECLLRKPIIANMVDESLRFYHGTKLELIAWVVMPNHVHVLFTLKDKSMGQVIADWKRYTARESNKLLGRTGKFWAQDYWDTYMRDSAHELRARRYIENNPVKAGLARQPKNWAWSSARFRDNFERLCL